MPFRLIMAFSFTFNLLIFFVSHPSHHQKEEQNNQQRSYAIIMYNLITTITSAGVATVKQFHSYFVKMACGQTVSAKHPGAKLLKFKRHMSHKTDVIKI